MPKLPATTDDTMILNLEGIPRALVQAFKAKARREFPPRAMRWMIVELMAAYVSGNIHIVSDAEKAKASRGRKGQPS